jgi:hypothetical protein
VQLQRRSIPVVFFLDRSGEEDMPDEREALRRNVRRPSVEDVKAVELECVGCIERGGGFAIAVEISPLRSLESSVIVMPGVRQYVIT